MSNRKIDTLTPKEQVVLHRLEDFAKKHNLELADFSGSLYVRVKEIVELGRCPCFSDRPHCPCPQVISECARDGECGCRVFLAKNWREIYRAKGII